ncbi:hypothetical protein Tco_1236247 [Tanacetum coccineum]
MDNPNITLEEYIELEAKKARRRDLETCFPSIVYKDALASDHEISSEPTMSPHHDNRVDFDFKISFDESDDEDYMVIYDKNSFSYKLISFNDLKSDSDNDNNEINIPSKDVSTKPLDSVIDSNVDTYS